MVYGSGFTTKKLIGDGLWIWLHHKKTYWGWFMDLVSPQKKTYWGWFMDLASPQKKNMISSKKYHGLWIWVTLILISSKKYLSFAVALTPIVHQYCRMLPTHWS
jgi:hypothetical protein